MEHLETPHSQAFVNTILDSKRYGAVRVDSIIVKSTPAIAACTQIERFATKALTSIDILQTFAKVHTSRKELLFWVPKRFRRYFITKTERQAIYAGKVALLFMSRAIASLRSSSQSVIDLDLHEFVRTASIEFPSLSFEKSDLRELRISYFDFFAHNDGINYGAILSSGQFLRLKSCLRKTLDLSKALELQLMAQRTVAVQILASEEWDNFGALSPTQKT